MMPAIDAVLASIAIEELDRIKAIGEVPTLEALLIRMEGRRGEHSLILGACSAFLGGGRAP